MKTDRGYKGLSHANTNEKKASVAIFRKGRLE